LVRRCAGRFPASALPSLERARGHENHGGAAQGRRAEQARGVGIWCGQQFLRRRIPCGFLSRSPLFFPSPPERTSDEDFGRNPHGRWCKGGGSSGWILYSWLGFGPPDGRQRAIWGSVACIHGRQCGRGQHHGEAAVRVAHCRLCSRRQQEEGERGIVSPG
jgi:hypothetical protein